MNEYTLSLQKRGFTASTINTYINEAQLFIKWCTSNTTTPEAIDYKTSLKYIEYLRRKNTSRKTVNLRLVAVKKYLNYLVTENYRNDNPIANTTVRGTVQHIHHHLLTSEELEDLYYSFETQNIKRWDLQLTTKRNKIITGLMVYQGLNTTNLKALELDDIELYKGKIHIRSHKKMNARTLELKPWQVIELLEYVNEIHPQLVKRNLNVDTNKLCIPSNDRLSNTILTIIKQLKKINQKVVNIHQIRASVISNWLGQYNLRKVQYLAGHRYISSTERYLQDDLENLHEIVNNFHPIS